MSAQLPGDVAGLIGQAQYPATADFGAELGYGWNTLAATENGNPLYWDAAVADALTSGPILPLSTLSIWMRPHRWSPGSDGERVALQAHFDLKARFDLPEAIMSDNTVVFREPVRPGDVISHRQVLRSVSDPKTTRLGTGRFWVIDVEYHNQHEALVGVESYTGFGYKRPAAPEATGTAGTGAPSPSSGNHATQPAGGQAKAHLQAGQDSETPSPDHSGESEASRDLATPPTGGQVKPDPTQDQVMAGQRLPDVHHDVTATTVVLGALASRDWRPMHHDYRFATERNGTRDIFLNTPNQLAWFERAVTDWTGPRGRLGRMSFRMRDPVFPGERMTISATVTAVPVDGAGCGWAELELLLQADGRTCTTGTARIALPASATDNPWLRHGEQWLP